MTTENRPTWRYERRPASGGANFLGGKVGEHRGGPTYHKRPIPSSQGQGGGGTGYPGVGQFSELTKQRDPGELGRCTVVKEHSPGGRTVLGECGLRHAVRPVMQERGQWHSKGKMGAQEKTKKGRYKKGDFLSLKK